MDIIICEGKYDAIFFDEITGKNSNTHTMYETDFKKLQGCLGRSFNYFNPIHPLIIYGDSGKPEIYKILEHTVKETIGKSENNTYIYLIIDDDGVEYAKLEKTVNTKLESLSRSKDRFFYPPTFEHNDKEFILKHPKNEYPTIVHLFTVPLNLEIQIAKKFVEIKCPHTSIRVDANPHLAINSLAKKYCRDDKELLFRKTSSFLKNETWVCDIVEHIHVMR